MKIIQIMLLATGLLLACNSKTESPSTVEPAAEIHAPDDHASGLVLNNGAKWKADLSTIGNVDLLQKVVSGAKKESLDNYLQTAAQLEAGLNKMVSECKMQGADHDALHLWLEPLMEKARDLKKVTSTETAATLLTEIDKQVNLFPQYFEK
ncbi:MAG: hypothetical protein IPH68_06495 [Chitinophagaceae bacterium]|nr:hypothetical protein [Chitinophagaceae bacterium]